MAYNRALALDTMAKVLSELSFKNTEDLLASLGYGKVTTGQIISRLLPDRTKSEPVKPGRLEQVLDKIRRKPSGGIRVQGLDDILVRFAKCCNPLPGDRVIGFISRGRGVTVHNTDCPKILETDPRITSYNVCYTKLLRSFLVRYSVIYELKDTTLATFFSSGFKIMQRASHN